MLQTMSLPPGPPLPALAQTYLWVRHPTELMNWCRRTYGPAFTISLPGIDMVVISDPAAIRTIFAAKPDEMHAGKVNVILRPLVGDSSVLLLDGAEHMHRRKLLLPSFHGARMRYYGETMAEITRRSIASWPLGEPFALHEQTQQITLEVILRTVFGADGEQLSELRDSIRNMLHATGNRSSFVTMLYLSAHPEAETRAPWKWLLKRRNETDKLLYKQIALRRGAVADSSRQDVLSMLLAARDENGEGLTDRELRDELMTALAAGHETTATALAWAFERVLADRAIYERLRDEVRALGSAPASEQLMALPYLDATIKEVLRLRPVVPIVGRVLRRPFSLAGYDLPAGTRVAPCIYLAQRDPDVYSEPDEFRPERFLDVQPDTASWLPFGGGIRRCIGASFALYEMKIVMATMLASCELEFAQRGPSRIVRRAVTFYPEGGARILLRSFAA
jgi:cytochrome P450 family 135